MKTFFFFLHKMTIVYKYAFSQDGKRTHLERLAFGLFQPAQDVVWKNRLCRRHGGAREGGGSRRLSRKEETSLRGCTEEDEEAWRHRQQCQLRSHSLSSPGKYVSGTEDRFSTNGAMTWPWVVSAPPCMSATGSQNTRESDTVTRLTFAFISLSITEPWLQYDAVCIEGSEGVILPLWWIGQF